MTDAGSEFQTDGAVHRNERFTGGSTRFLMYFSFVLCVLVHYDIVMCSESFCCV